MRPSIMQGNTRESRALYYRLAAETYVRLLDLMVKKLEPTDRRIPDTRYKFAQLLASGFNFSAAVLQAPPSPPFSHHRDEPMSRIRAGCSGHVDQAKQYRRLDG